MRHACVSVRQRGSDTESGGVIFATSADQAKEWFPIYTQLYKPNIQSTSPQEYYCNKHRLLGTPILHDELLSTVQWNFWQELARSIWDLSIRQRCTADGGKYCAFNLQEYLMMHGSYLEVSI